MRGDKEKNYCDMKAQSRYSRNSNSVKKKEVSVDYICYHSVGGKISGGSGKKINTVSQKIFNCVCERNHSVDDMCGDVVGADEKNLCDSIGDGYQRHVLDGLGELKTKNVPCTSRVDNSESMPDNCLFGKARCRCPENCKEVVHEVLWPNNTAKNYICSIINKVSSTYPAVSTFSGRKGESIEDWLRQFKIFAQLVDGFDENNLHILASAHLRDDAGKFYDDLQQEPKTFKQFKEIMLNRYSLVPKDRPTLLRGVLNRYQQPGESASEFASTMYNLGGKSWDGTSNHY